MAPPSYVVPFGTGFARSFGHRFGGRLRLLWGGLRPQPLECCLLLCRILLGSSLRSFLPPFSPARSSRGLRPCTVIRHHLVPRWFLITVFCSVLCCGVRLHLTVSLSTPVFHSMLVCLSFFETYSHFIPYSRSQGACEACRTPQATQWLRHWQAFGLYYSRFYGELVICSLWGTFSN